MYQSIMRQFQAQYTRLPSIHHSCQLSVSAASRTAGLLERGARYPSKTSRS